MKPARWSCRPPCRDARYETAANECRTLTWTWLGSLKGQRVPSWTVATFGWPAPRACRDPRARRTCAGVQIEPNGADLTMAACAYSRPCSPSKDFNDSLSHAAGDRSNSTMATRKEEDSALPVCTFFVHSGLWMRGTGASFWSRGTSLVYFWYKDHPPPAQAHSPLHGS